MDFRSRRKFYFIVAVLIQILAGFLYAWSVVKTPLAEKFGWSSAAITLGYTFNLLGTALLTLFGSDLKKKLGLRKCILLGGIFIGAGLVGCGFVRQSVWEVYFWYGLIYGIGVGLTYPTLTVYCVHLYPDRSGMASGLSTGAFALGAFIWGPAATSIYEEMGDISYAFIYMGLAMLLGISVLSFFIREVPEDFSASAEQKVSAESLEPAFQNDINRRQMLASSQFYALFITMSLGMAAGSMVVSYGSTILESTFHMALQNAALLVGAFSLASVVGRIGFGAVSDKLGKPQTTIIMSIVMGAALLLLQFVGNIGFYVAMLIVCVVCYGGFASMVSPITKFTFGEKYFAENYSIIYFTYAVSGLIGPPIISLMKDMTGELSGAYKVGCLFCIISLVCAIFLMKRAAGAIQSVQSQAEGTPQS